MMEENHSLHDSQKTKEKDRKGLGPFQGLPE
jgi:hypothetical protein